MAGGYGTIGTLVGYFLMYAGASDQYNVSNGWIAMALYAALWQNASASCDTVAISVQVINLPADRGLVLGMVKSFFGFSAIMIAIVHSGYYEGDAPGLLLFLTVAASSVTGVATACQALVGGQAAATTRARAAAHGVPE